MALDWNNIPTTEGKKRTFADLDPQATYNVKFMEEKDQRIFSPDNSNVKSGFLGIFKAKTTNGGDSVGTFVQLMLNLDEADEKWIGTQQNLIIKVAEAAGLNRLEFPSDAAALMDYLRVNLPGKEISVQVKESGMYNGNKQWAMNGWSAGKPAAFFSAPIEDDLVTPQDAVPEVEGFDF